MLFIAFGGGTGLLPQRLLQKAAKEQSSWRPVPVWDNFQQLFRFIDKGSGPPLQIWAYNGGLFAPDPVLDAIVLPDHLAQAVADIGNWDFGSEIPVTVLGRIFEQSITDLEKLRAEAEGRPAPDVGKVKKEGVVYTPDHIARFLVEQTAGKTLAERFAALLKQHTGRDSLPKSDDDTLWPSPGAEARFWQDYLEVLRSLKVLDPACGSGAFLAAAFDVLAADYARVLNRLDELKVHTGLDAFDEILGRNLFGVDLNIESVEITRLSLWLKTARQKHRLASLDETIRDGNSLIGEKNYADRPFAWDGRFADILKQGGFDIVIGNPPYVRMELLKDQKPYFSKHYEVADERTDLYAYFFEKGVDVLKPGGRLGYISSSSFFRTGSGVKLRALMAEETEVETVIDFGDEQIFEGVTTYPAIITARKLAKDEQPAGELRFFNIRKLPPDLGSAFQAQSQAMPRNRLGSASWQFESDALARLRDKIAKGRKTLGEVYGAPLRGIITGLNDAFIINTPTRDRLIARDPKSADLLKPFLKGEHIKRWRVEPEGLFLINIPKGKISIDDYPAIRDHLFPFKAELERRATKQEWFELQQAQLAYQKKFLLPKISYPHFQNSRMFCLEIDGSFSNDKSYFIPTGDLALLAYLNSNVSWVFLCGVSPAVRNGWHEMRVQYVESLPLANLTAATEAALIDLAQICTELSRESFQISRAVYLRVVADLAKGRAVSAKLQEWYQLAFAQFRSEVKRVFRADIPVRERAEWEAYLTEEGTKVKALSAQIAAAEAEINRLVYAAFDLTDPEISLLEESLAGQL
ncbi:MAG: N-6 DNA methylase [Aestuariivirga sp.]|uniref:Eco57I restriction-modification methylase domain-containing protein n=1 Tax=Aestuariivirga sp. TaxID=2650926 RepID=UPI0025B89802|nr:N-6 DNA methylase [Aestuariivirga sp.]MCA3561158.1 N-6 DNA methylase [Aestuariivirga sp.]